MGGCSTQTQDADRKYQDPRTVWICDPKHAIRTTSMSLIRVGRVPDVMALMVPAIAVTLGKVVVVI